MSPPTPTDRGGDMVLKTVSAVLQPQKHHGIGILSAAICYRKEQVTDVSTKPSAETYSGRAYQRGVQAGIAGASPGKEC